MYTILSRGITSGVRRECCTTLDLPVLVGSGREMSVIKPRRLEPPRRSTRFEGCRRLSHPYYIANPCRRRQTPSSSGRKSLNRAGAPARTPHRLEIKQRQLQLVDHQDPNARTEHAPIVADASQGAISATSMHHGTHLAVGVAAKAWFASF